MTDQATGQIGGYTAKFTPAHREFNETVLLLLGVPERAVMEFMGWSNSAMAKRYQHVTAVLRNEIAKRLSGFLWQESRSGVTDRCPMCGRGPEDN